MTNDDKAAWEKYVSEQRVIAAFEKRAFQAGRDSKPDREWQPIDTAPRDGTHVLTYRSERTGSNPVMAENFVVGSKGRPNTGWWYSMQDTPWTHWMPLPQPPQPDLQEET